MQLYLASSNPGKLREYRVLAGDSPIEVALLPNFSEIPAFEKTALTFAENAAGKAMHYSRFATGTVLADDSGLIANLIDQPIPNVLERPGRSWSNPPSADGDLPR